MRATVMYGARDVRLETLPDPQLSTGDDAIVRVVAACVCGSDLWPYRGVTPVAAPRQVGHEFVGVVEQIGRDVGVVKSGDFVIAPFYICDGSCSHCRNGVSTSCVNGSWWGSPDRKGRPADGGQGEYVRVPLADGTLFPIGDTPDPAMIPSLVTLSDVMCTGHHAAVSAGVRPGSVVVVVGDGAVGLCAVLAARRLGAETIVAMSRHPARQAMALEFGATHIVADRADAGVCAVHRLTGGIGADCVLECVGTEQSMRQALGSARPGGRIGFVGLPNGGPKLPITHLFDNNVGVQGGIAPVRGYMADLLPDVLTGTITPGRVFDLHLPLADITEAYLAMDQRRAIKTLLVL
jgi:threonine dehydrogenase-like Zn-dependent dehydrogenase